ncbi:tetratricopeptide repeat-containing sensor histidine kinase [uncultured Tenacibaculum sp.]|uniref:tetratricopeptide repeat-containing sensor histidine kinase n=1 Tax=uncultured Tenacibaculum sp. TaxID=174713 RepID=UPI00260C5129|nr:tetratricopeptide repeat-containing sensor histidine kinase [uncultured Tenacibaculum sp.]
MNYKPLLFLLLFKSFLTFSQTRKTKDSIFFTNVSKVSSEFFSRTYFKKASIYFFEKNWDSTLVYAQKQLDSPNQNKQIKNYCYLYRGISLDKKKLYQEALNQLSLITSDFVFLNRVQIYKGALNIKLNKYEKAISYLKDLEHIPKSELASIYKDDILNDLGLCFLFLKDYKKAEKYFKESYQKEKDTSNLIDKQINIANLYYNLYQDDIAIPYFENAYKLSERLKINNNDLTKTGLNEKKRQIYDQKRLTAKNMSVVEENRKAFQKALKYRKEYEQWKDSLNDQSKIYAVAQKEKEFAVQQKQNEVDILQVKNELQETQRTIFLYAAIGLLVLLGISLYFYREKVKRNKIIASQKEDLNTLNATKDKLFSIVSHDLRSSVNALKTSNVSLVKNLDSNNLSALRNLLQNNSAIVNGAYGLLDNLLNWALLQTNQGYFSISSLRLFFITEQVSFNYQPLLLEKELSFENTVSKKDIVFADQESLKIVLRNLLDNAIKFSKPNGSIKIYTRNSSETYCDLIIEDTGLGMSEATRLDLLKDTALLNKKEHEDVIGTGLGLQLCKSMIQKNNGKFSIESELGKGTKMIVSLPKNPSNE